MSFDDFVSRFVQTRLPGLSQPHLTFLTNCLTKPNVLATLKLNPDQQKIAQKLFETFRSSLGHKADAYPTTQQGVVKFFTNGNKFLTAEYQKQLKSPRSVAVVPARSPSAATPRPRSRSVTAVDDVPHRSRSRSATDSLCPPPSASTVAVAATPVMTSVQQQRPRARFISAGSIDDVDDLCGTAILPVQSHAGNHRMVPYRNQLPVPYDDDSDSSESLSDCDENVSESSFVCRHVYKKDCGRKRAGDQCGREYHSARYLCPNCGCCSGLHVMSGHQIVTINPRHCNCMSKKYCGGHGGRTRNGLPCDARVRGGGRCLRHRHKRRVCKLKHSVMRSRV